MLFRFTSSSALSLFIAASMLLLAACSAIVDPDVGSLPPDNSVDSGGPIIDRDLGARDAGDGDGGGPVIDLDLGGRDAGVPPTDLGGGMTCTGGTRCVGAELTECISGVERRTPCALGCPPSALPRCAEFVPSNVPADFLGSGTEDIEVGAGEVGRIDTNACSSERLDTQVVEQPGGLELCVYIVRNVEVAAGGTITVGGERPLVIVASGDIDIAGTIDVSARQGEPGPGGGAGGFGDALNGEGVANGTGGEHVDTFDDGGGGGGGMCGAGGAGGLGGTAAGGAGGAAVTTELTPLIGGSGGGRGRGTTLTSGSLAGYGGAGGGALQLSARGALRISGALLAGGGGGGAGRVGTMSSINWGSGGGAGSGGAVLLEAISVEVTASARIVVAAGGGGGGASNGRSGSNGADGAAATPSVGGAGGGGTLDTTGGDGALSVLDGLDGEGSASPTANGAGGGGGAGCIVARTGDAMLAGGAAVSRPAASLRTLPVLRR